MSRFGFSRFFQRNGEKDAPSEKEMEQSKGVVGARLKPNPGTRVLIVDDSKTIHLVLTRLLQRHGYETLSAYDGENAIDLARSHKPALILMDVVMPGLNGFHATREIRKDRDPEVAAIPVVIMSGNAQPTEEFWSVKIKANGFIAKPFNEEDLFSHIERLLYPNASEAG
jgi:twitching motility two-component system response regulator PilH